MGNSVKAQAKRTLRVSAVRLVSENGKVDENLKHAIPLWMPKEVG